MYISYTHICLLLSRCHYPSFFPFPSPTAHHPQGKFKHEIWSGFPSNLGKTSPPGRQIRKESVLCQNTKRTSRTSAELGKLPLTLDSRMMSVSVGFPDSVVLNSVRPGIYPWRFQGTDIDVLGTGFGQ